MAKLTGQTIADSYDQLLIVDNASGISASLQAIEAGDTGGSASSLKISTSKCEVIPASNSTSLFEVSQADGTPVLSVDTTNVRVGIGTASPSQLLHVEGAGSIKALVKSTNSSAGVQITSNAETNNSSLEFLSGGASAGQVYYDHHATAGQQKMYFQVGDGAVNAMIIDGIGNVGIGTSSPDALLHLESSTTDKPNLIIENTGTADGVQGGSIYFRLADTNTNLVDNLDIGDIVFQGWNVTGSDWEPAAMIRGKKDGATGGNNDMGGELQFFTTPDGSATNVLRMCILNSGNVGIGTTAPGTLLHVHAADGESVNNHVASFKNMETTAGDSEGVLIQAGTSANDSALEISSQAASSLFIVRGNGNIGIGTTAPGNKLEVAESGSAAVIATFREDDDINNTEVLGRLLFQGSDVGVAATRKTGAYIEAKASADWSASGDYHQPTDINFYTENASDTTSASTPRMTIDHDGNVGIGTTSPTAGLHVDGGSAHHVPSTSDETLTPSLRVEQNGDNACIDFGTTTSGVNRAYIHARSDRATYDANGLPLTLNELGGNVGIGTAAPGANLDVEGSAGDTVIIEVTAPASLDGDNETAKFMSVATAAGSTTTTEIGTRFHTSQHDTNKALSYMLLTASDQTISYLWIDDNDLFRGSTTAGHLGTTSGVAISSALSSDERLKDISKDPFPYGLSDINSITPIKYKKKKGSTRDRLGFGAQTIQSIIPESVQDTGQCIHGYDNVKDESGNFISIAKGDESETSLVMEYHQIIPVLVKAIQELSAKVTALENA